MADEFEARGAEGSRSSEGARYADPYGLYRRWFEAWEGNREGDAGYAGADEIEELWRHWFRGTARGLRRGPGGPEGSLGPLWDRMAESMKEEAVSRGGLPPDPVEFFLRWYEGSGEEWTKTADELLQKDETLESHARLQREFARSYRELKKASEESLQSLQISSRSDVARVAKLVVGLENKVDRLEEAFGEFVYGGSKPATAEAVHGLQERMDALEAKMDRILAALEKDES